MSIEALEQELLRITLDAFGKDVTYSPSMGDETEIKGVFDNAYVEVEGIVLLRATLRINLSDLSSRPVKGDSLEVSDTIYDILESREDGYGGTTLILQKA